MTCMYSNNPSLQNSSISYILLLLRIHPLHIDSHNSANLCSIKTLRPHMKPPKQNHIHFIHLNALCPSHIRISAFLTAQSHTPSGILVQHLACPAFGAHCYGRAFRAIRHRKRTFPACLRRRIRILPLLAFGYTFLHAPVCIRLQIVIPILPIQSIISNIITSSNHQCIVLSRRSLYKKTQPRMSSHMSVHPCLHKTLDIDTQSKLTLYHIITILISPFAAR